MHSMPMQGTYDLHLVGLSILIAILASYATLDVAGRVTAARKSWRIYWLVGGATSMGVGIWAMHYIGMLAFEMPMTVYYDLPTVLVSLLAAVAASTIALLTVSRDRLERRQMFLASVFMGGGIAAMHYIGMAAMRMPARTHYNPFVVALSIVLAITISYVALVLCLRVREEMQTSWRKVFSALLMGAAIPTMHYTGMWAVTFFASDNPIDLSHAVNISYLGLVAISISALVILMLAIGTSYLDRLVGMQRNVVDLAQQHEEHFRNLAEAIPQIVWTATPDGAMDFYSRRWFEYTGLTAEQSQGEGWRPMIHPEDLPLTVAIWQRVLRSGEAYETQFRLLRAKDQTYRWHLVRAHPVRDNMGAIVKWFGTSTDIDDQHRNQESLEGVVRQRTAALAQANASLKEEMAERERAQKEMNVRSENLVQELTERSTKMSLLGQMGELLQSDTNMDEAFSIITGFAPKIFRSWRGAIMLLNSSRNLLEVVGTWGSCSITSTFFAPNSCWSLRTGHRYVVEAGDCSAPCAHAVGCLESYICMPILAHGEALGFIHFQIPGEKLVIPEAKSSVLSAFVEQVGLSVANIRLREALRMQSIRDPLTGLFNRRYLEETFDREMKRVTRTQQPLSVLMLDLDHFKRFNDTFGHHAGDTILQETGSLFSKRIRADDIACRYGGEEFVLVLPNADLAMACSRGELIRDEVKKLEVMRNGTPLGQITVSIGVAAFPSHGSTAPELMAAADAALYQAKNTGRDRVVSADSRKGDGASIKPDLKQLRKKAATAR
jgi:diguanylate cyclase (GGDEF)-like protein/PAS domain S-box-containing protein